MEPPLKQNLFNPPVYVEPNQVGEGGGGGEATKTYKDVLKDLAGSSSLHGIGKISSSRQLAVKLLWCTLLMATMSLFGIQLTELISQFYSYPIQTAVSLKHGSLKFPSITICNMNAMRASASQKSDTFSEYTAQRLKRSADRKMESDGAADPVTAASTSGKRRDAFLKERPGVKKQKLPTPEDHDFLANEDGTVEEKNSRDSAEKPDNEEATRLRDLRTNVESYTSSMAAGIKATQTVSADMTKEHTNTKLGRYKDTAEFKNSEGKHRRSFSDARKPRRRRKRGTSQSMSGASAQTSIYYTSYPTNTYMSYAPNTHTSYAPYTYTPYQTNNYTSYAPYTYTPYQTNNYTSNAPYTNTAYPANTYTSNDPYTNTAYPANTYTSNDPYTNTAYPANTYTSNAPYTNTAYPANTYTSNAPYTNTAYPANTYTSNAPYSNTAYPANTYTSNAPYTNTAYPANTYTSNAPYTNTAYPANTYTSNDPYTNTAYPANTYTSNAPYTNTAYPANTYTSNAPYTNTAYPANTYTSNAPYTNTAYPANTYTSNAPYTNTAYPANTYSSYATNYPNSYQTPYTTYNYQSYYTAYQTSSYSNSGSGSGSYSDTDSYSDSDSASYSGADDSYSSYTSGDDYTAYLAEQLYAKKDEWETSKEVFKVLFKSVTRTERRKLGHTKEHLIHSATFAGVIQNVSSESLFAVTVKSPDCTRGSASRAIRGLHNQPVQSGLFKDMSTVEYGNCATMESSKYISWLAGPSNGIKLTVNVQINEYVSKYAEMYGIRLVIHESGTFPFAAEEGISIPSSSETNIALKLVNVQHLGPPYGECTDGAAFFQKYGYKYTKTACYQFCRTERIQDECGCIPPTGPDVELNTTALPVCNTTKAGEQKECLLATELTLNDKCKCLKPCSQNIYEKTIATGSWPSSEYLNDYLLPALCGTNNSDTSLANECKLAADGYPVDYFRTKDNFLKVAIYFEDLNYETITEEPSYTRVRFVSDVGGAMGLFMGASVLTYVELLQLCLETFFYVKKKYFSSNTEKTAVTPMT